MRYHKYVKFCKSKLRKLIENIKMESPSIVGNPQFRNVLENGDLFCPLYGHKCCFPDYRHLSCKFCAGKLAVRRGKAE